MEAHSAAHNRIKSETRIFLMVIPFNHESLCPSFALAMRAFVVNQLNHPSKIALTEDAPEPKPVPDKVLVDVYSAGLNFFDVSKRLCLHPVVTNL